MGEPTRRGFLALAGAGAAATAAVAIGTTTAAEHAADADSLHNADDIAGATESFVVHVKDAKRGQLAILTGDRELLVTDRELAGRLARAAQSATL
jgi:anaerobic selenocysteine-containing dehydrogenase